MNNILRSLDFASKLTEFCPARYNINDFIFTKRGIRFTNGPLLNIIESETAIMIPILVSLAFIAGITSEQYQEYARHSNGNQAYELVFVGPCNPGKHESGYVLTPIKTIMLKQKNRDGTAGSVCIK